MLRKLLVALSAIALVIGLAPAASAQNTDSVRIGDFTFTATINQGQSQLRPGGYVRIDLTAKNTHGQSSWIPPDTGHRVLHSYGFTVPSGFTLRSSGGSNMSDVGNRDQGALYFGGGGGGLTSPVAKDASRSGWISFNIPANAKGGDQFSFGVRAELETIAKWFPTADNVVGFTLGAVGTNASVSANPATVEEGTTTSLTAAVTPQYGSNGVAAGDVRFEVGGVLLGVVPVGANGRASIPYTAPLLDNRDPVTQTVRARYLGDAPRFAASGWTTNTVRIDPEPKSEVTSTVGLTATRGLVENGQLPVTLDVAVDTSSGTDLPEGAKVEILRDGVVVDTIAVNGVAATYTDHLDADVAEATVYRYTARLLESETYDTIYRGAESDPVDVTLAAETTPEVTVAVDPASVLVGRAVDVTASMTADGAPLPAGAEVIIRANGRDIGTVTTDDDGSATLTDHVFTTPGDKTIEAVFEGALIDGRYYLPVTSAPATLTVESLPEVDSGTTIELQTEVTAGDEVTITATVSRFDGRELTDAGTDDLGSVWFFSDGEAIGSAPVTIDPETGEATAVFTHRFAERGEYRMTADYSGASGSDEVIAPSETASATVVTVTTSEIVIEEPGPPEPDPIMVGSLDLGSVTDALGEEGLSSLTGMFGGN